MKKKQLLSSAPWRGEEENEEKFKDGKLKVTNQPGSTPTMYVPGKKSVSSKSSEDNNDSLSEIDPELKYSFQRNFMFLQRVFSIDTIVKPLPPALSIRYVENGYHFLGWVNSRVSSHCDSRCKGIIVWEHRWMVHESLHILTPSPQKTSASRRDAELLQVA
ncbi:hypothetical protein BVC80_1729g35 [Macleaya cordata]|uniref:Uncharacterized protein n=1 Tax=Macleaya cordata TaxID=56857 RepID=A0A200QCD4_MACCD|nr:hypothetical protein BVC80_1729g35 [Macleaya cordata]